MDDWFSFCLPQENDWHFSTPKHLIWRLEHAILFYSPLCSIVQVTEFLNHFILINSNNNITRRVQGSHSNTCPTPNFMHLGELLYIRMAFL